MIKYIKNYERNAVYWVGVWWGIGEFYTQVPSLYNNLNIQVPLTAGISIPVSCTLDEYNVNVIYFLNFIHRLGIRLCFRRPIQKGSDREVHFLLLKKEAGLASERLRLNCKSTLVKLRTK